LKPTDSIVTKTAPRAAPQIVTLRLGEKAAPRKVANTISKRRLSSVPGDDPEPRANTNIEARKPVHAARKKDIV
jgi:hypothetical protein